MFPRLDAAWCGRRLGLAGRDDFTPQRGVDVLLEHVPGRLPGLALFSMEAALYTA